MIFCLIFGPVMLVLGFLLGRHRYNQYDGHVELEEDGGGVFRANLIMNGDPETLLTTKSSIRFKVNRDEVSRS